MSCWLVPQYIVLFSKRIVYTVGLKVLSNVLIKRPDIASRTVICVFLEATRRTRLAPSSVAFIAKTLLS